MPARQTPEFVYRRGELMAEIYLTSLGAKVTKSPSEAVDFLAFFESDGKAMHVVAVEVKARETPIPAEFEIDSGIAAQAAHSNIPTLLLVIDVKQNKIGFAWIDEFARLHESTPRKGKIRIPLQDAENHREQIRDRILATAIAVA